MIKHHPKLELIQAYVNGDLPASLSMGISMHAEMCPACQQKIVQLTEQAAAFSFEDEQHIFGGQAADIEPSFDFESMIENITASDAQAQTTTATTKSITFKGQTFALPTALNHVQLARTANVGKLSRTRLQLDEEEVHSSLLHISAGGGVPEHTHKGFELTLLLDGSFSDDDGEYVKGDFIMLDASIKHNPISKEGCLCYTVANDALHFTQGINKLLNPIGNFIY